MQSIVFWVCMLVAGFWHSSVRADIYTWVDDKGERHISNVSPPSHAELLVKTDTSPRREVTPSAQQAAQQRRELARLQADIREREERLARKEAELEQRVEEAEQKVEDALAEAQNRIEAAEARYERDQKQPVAFTYVTRPFPYRYYHLRGHPYRYRYYSKRHHRYRPAPRHGLSVELSPFRLGSSTISINSGRYDYRRHSRHGTQVGRSRHPGGTHAPFHGRPYRSDRSR